MKVILLSGGSGKRLWPLSNELRPKQFLKVIKRGDGTYCSMLQNVWSHLECLGLEEHTVIATNKHQAQIIYSQIGTQVTIVQEPQIWDTYAAIALSCVHLYDRKNVSIDETVVVLPIDSFAEQSYYSRIGDMDRILNESGAPLALVGIRPLEPTDKYGYMIPDPTQAHNEILRIHQFAEKPALEAAERLIDQGALWNSGMFAFRLGYMIDLLQERNVPIQYEQLSRSYTSLPRRSFDYEVVEHEKHIAAVAYEGEWTDLGTWTELTSHMSHHVHGLGSVSEDSEATYLINELNIPVVVMGIPNAIVAASSDGILISSKAHNATFKQAIESFVSRPMFEERSFGSIRILDCSKSEDGREIITSKIHIHAGKNFEDEYHEERTETWQIIKGEAWLRLDGKKRAVGPGDVIEIMPSSHHGLLAITDVDLIEVQMGVAVSSEDGSHIVERLKFM